MLAGNILILHIVDAAAAELGRIVIKMAGFEVGIAATIGMKLYQTGLGAHGWKCITLSPTQLRDQVRPAIAAIKGNQLANAFEPLADIIHLLVARGATAVVLG